MTENRKSENEQREMERGMTMDRKDRWKLAGVAVLGTVVLAGGVAFGTQLTSKDVASNKILEQTLADSAGNTDSKLTAKQLSQKEETHEITIHYKWKGSQPHVYYKVESTNAETTYPGVPMKDEGNGWFTYTISEAEAADLIISVPEKSYQTSEFSRVEGEYWYDDETGWYTKEPSIYEPPVLEQTEVAKETQIATEEKEVQVDQKEVAEDSKITLHFKKDWDNTKIYYWNALPNDLEVAWPGEQLTKDEDGYDTCTLTGVNKVNFLFHNDTEQTEDFTVKSAGEYWYHDGKWVTEKPEGGEEDETPTQSPEETPVVTPTKTPDHNDEEEPDVVKPVGGDFRDESIYFVITTRFYDGDSSNNFHCSAENASTAENDPAWRGDFKGLIERLDYIKALGFSAVWITPVVQNRSGLDYHGYHAYNFTKVDSRYESSGATYQDLINAAHNKGMKIIQDVVFNHSCNWGEENLLQLNSDSYPDRNATVMNGKNDGGNIYHHNGFTGGGDWDNEKAQNTTIADDCFDFETENPTVYNYLVDCYKKYIGMGVDGFRVDTVKHISRLTLNAAFLPELRKAGGSSFYMFGEVCTKGHDVWYRDAPPISTCFYTWADDDSWLSKWSTDLGSNESLVDAHYTANMDKSNQPTSTNALLEGNTYHEPDYS